MPTLTDTVGSWNFPDVILRVCSCLKWLFSGISQSYTIKTWGFSIKSFKWPHPLNRSDFRVHYRQMSTVQEVSLKLIRSNITSFYRFIQRSNLMSTEKLSVIKLKNWNLKSLVIIPTSGNSHKSQTSTLPPWLKKLNSVPLMIPKKKTLGWTWLVKSPNGTSKNECKFDYHLI